MKNMKMIFDKSRIDRIGTFISDNKVLFAAMGGLATGVALTGLLGSDRAKQILKTAGGAVKDISGKVVNELGGFKGLFSVVAGKHAIQGL